MAGKTKSKKPPDPRKALQQRLWSAMAAEVLSPVTLGIAHDLNNQLTGILSISDLCLQDTALDRRLREQLEIIRGSGERAAALVRTLFTEHQANLGRSALHDLNTLAKAHLELAQRAIPKSIQVNLVLAPEPLPIMVDGVAFRTALLHLTLSLTAAVNRATLQVRTSAHAKAPDTAKFKGATPKRGWATCAVRLVGLDINPKKPQLLFDPVAKDATMESRFALDLVNDFAQVSGSFLSFDQNQKSGQTATMWFPQADVE